MSKTKFTKISKSLPIIVLSIIILFTAFMSIHYVSAGGGSFKQADTNWDDYSNNVDASLEDTYPYNSKTATIKSVSMDILYGKTRELVYYHGELPYDCIYDADDNYVEDWDGYYAEDGTSISGDNPSYGASVTPSAEDYWGTGLTATNFENPPTAEQINGNNTVSLRLLALTKTKTGFAMKFGSIMYNIVNWLAGAAVFIISLIVQAKNLSMDLIMDILRLDDLNDIMTKNFIFNGKTSTLSPFTAFCIIALIFSLVAFVIRWVNGRDKTKGIWEIIGTTFLGLLIIGMCLTGRISSLGQSVSTMANNVLYTVANSLTSSVGSAFNTEIKDADKDTEITQMCEMSLVNKAYIDLQLCAQFNVTDVEKLQFDNFGDTNGTIAKKYLSGVSNADMKKDFNNNLGYYYWFANSSAKEKTSLNKTYPSTNTISVTNKLSSMITYLQKQYNANSADATKASLIKSIVESFASPSNGAKFCSLLVFAVALVLMAVVLLKYAINVVIAKVELFVALLGLIVAGPLMLTSNKKLVNSGKSILGALVVSFLEITVYSIVFDIIIYAVSLMFAPNIPSLLATIALLLLLLKFNPILASNIKQIMERTERKISPALVDSKRAIKNYARRKASEGINRYDQSKKVVGYDANGNAIERERKGNLASKMMHLSSNALFNEGYQHESAHKINKDLNATKKQNINKTNAEKRKDAQNRINNTLDNINNEADNHYNNMLSQYDKELSNIGQLEAGPNSKFASYNEDALTKEELESKKTLDSLNQDIEDIQNSDKYKKLVAEQEHIAKRNEERLANNLPQLEMDEKRKAELASMKMKIGAKKKQVETQKKLLDDSIKQRAAEKVFSQNNLDYNNAEGDDLYEKMSNSTKQQAFNEHRNELENVLKESINTMTPEVNEGKTNVVERAGRKIGSELGMKPTTEFNVEAGTAQAAAMLQLNQLQNGEIVMSTADASKVMENSVRQVADKYNGTSKARANESVVKANQAVHEQRVFSKGRKEAKNDRKEAVAKYEQDLAETKAANKATYKAAKEDAGFGLGSISASEYIQGAVNEYQRNNATSTVANKTRMQKPERKHNVETPSAKPDMSSIINSRQNATVQEIPQHAKTDTVSNYQQDEARRVQRRQEEDFWLNNSSNRTNGPTSKTGQ